MGPGGWINDRIHIYIPTDAGTMVSDGYAQIHSLRYYDRAYYLFLNPFR